MVAQQSTHEPPPYSYRLPTREQILAQGPESSLGVAIIRAVQETLPGTSDNDTWRLVQNVADLMREFRELRRRGGSPGSVPEGVRTGSENERNEENCPYSNPSKDVLMCNSTTF